MPTWLQNVLAVLGFWLCCSVLNTWWRGYLRSRGLDDSGDPEDSGGPGDPPPSAP